MKTKVLFSALLEKAKNTGNRRFISIHKRPHPPTIDIIATPCFHAIFFLRPVVS